MLFLSWGQDSERKKALDHSDYMEKNIKEKIDIDGESAGFIEIQNQKLIVKINPITGEISEVRLKEHTFLKNKDSLGVRVFGFDEKKGFTFYLRSGFGANKPVYSVVKVENDVYPNYLELISEDGLVTKKNLTKRR